MLVNSFIFIPQRQFAPINKWPNMGKLKELPWTWFFLHKERLEKLGGSCLTHILLDAIQWLQQVERNPSTPANIVRMCRGVHADTFHPYEAANARQNEPQTVGLEQLPISSVVSMRACVCIYKINTRIFCTVELTKWDTDQLARDRKTNMKEASTVRENIPKTIFYQDLIETLKGMLGVALNFQQSLSQGVGC